MASTACYLAFDLGASGGRAILGRFDGARLRTEAVHRFANEPLRLPSGIHWNTPGLFEEVKRGMTACRAMGVEPEGLGLDTWGVDYGLIGTGGELLGLPHHYRDTRTIGKMDEAWVKVGKERLYLRTGIQYMSLNTIYQLMADRDASDGRLAHARTLLFTPDLLAYWLTGEARTELSIASTSQLLDPGTGTWATDVASSLGLPTEILPRIEPCGTAVGALRREVAEETGLSGVTVVAPASHDTASAVAATPGEGDAWAYISCGTWSLVGTEVGAPVRTREAMRAGFTNEGGLLEGRGRLRFHHNVAGLWLLQECQRTWRARGGAWSHEDTVRAASGSEPLGALIDPDDASFGGFGDMPTRVDAFVRRTGQPVIPDEAAMARAIIESLALAYAATIEQAEALTGRELRVVHMVGGGIRNALLCQCTADATGREVVAGPAEATAAGNILTQAMAFGRVRSAEQIRAVVRQSFDLVTYRPRERSRWSEARARFATLVARGRGG
ncbi:MAG: rhamnulokinase [Phycisphaerae bacterium]|nr:rhamnulokinase [Phycisphaerae bacterium]